MSRVSRAVQVVSKGPGTDQSLEETLDRAVADLWTMKIESGEDFVVLMDRRRLDARVERKQSGQFEVSWEAGDSESWTVHDGTFDNPREAAFRAFQGPH